MFNVFQQAFVQINWFMIAFDVDEFPISSSGYLTYNRFPVHCKFFDVSAHNTQQKQQQKKNIVLKPTTATSPLFFLMTVVLTHFL